MEKKVLKETPLQEITLRKYESPQGLEKADLARKFLLSVGLLQPGESRDILVYIFRVLLVARQKKQAVSIEKFLELLRNRPGASAPNIRRQLRRLKEYKLAEKVDKGYRITEFGSISKVLEKFIIPFIIEGSVERLKEYAGALD